MGQAAPLSRRMIAAWTTFARSGTPGDDWPPFPRTRQLARYTHSGVDNDIGTPLAEADYIGATAHELSEKRAATKLAAGISQRTLFQRRGRIMLHSDLLVLTGWSDDGDLSFTPRTSPPPKPASPTSTAASAAAC
ncbi:hypothetical protein ABTZ93_38400 [Streptomyces sp. NPDC097941]|uniref:hypothetical protein n=1 Tax=Streptomyces sp. NPDC097941 TaxID=3155685 RepID=UPI003326B503